MGGREGGLFSRPEYGLAIVWHYRGFFIVWGGEFVKECTKTEWGKESSRRESVRGCVRWGGLSKGKIMFSKKFLILMGRSWGKSDRWRWSLLRIMERFRRVLSPEVDSLSYILEDYR